MSERIGSVFISHSAKEPDHGVTQALAQALQDVGIDVWWDKDGLEGGDFFPVEILEAIIRQHYFLFVVSPRSVESKWCQRELIRATELGRHIRPLILEHVADEKSPLELAGLQYVNITEGVGKAMPAILKALGLGDRTASGAPDDPFARDGRLLHAIADQLPYAKTFANCLNTVEMLKKIGITCSETERARGIFAGMTADDLWGVGKIDLDKVTKYLLEQWSK